MIQEKVFTVSQLNSYVASILSNDHVLSRVCIKGEISNCKYHTSGHIYFKLKDSGSELAGVIWAFAARQLKVRLQDGMQVTAKGQIKVYEKTGIYQLYAEDIEPDGQGALYALYEKLLAKLRTEGLFDAAHKKPIPTYCKTVGIVTAQTGAAIRDICSIAKRRNPYVKLILYPALVQGTGSAESVIRGIKAFEKIKPDVIIIGRGGGSIEDLWGFNDEELARVIYACPIPIISAVGHEIDFTIADYVADARAATPSEAAEKAVCEIEGVIASLVDLHSDLVAAMMNKIELYRQKTEHYSLKLRLVSPRGRLDSKRKELEINREKLKKLMQNRLLASKHQLAVNASRLEGLSPLKRLEAGYAYMTDGAGHNVKSVEEIEVGASYKIRVTDGTVTAEVTEKNNG